MTEPRRELICRWPGLDAVLNVSGRQPFRHRHRMHPEVADDSPERHSRTTVTGDPHGNGMHFLVKNIKGAQASVPVVYRGTVPDLFKATRHITVDGRMRNGTFVAVPGSLVTKCPSKYEAAKPAAT